VEKTGTDKYRLLIQLEEKVPYRIYSETGRTIIELNRLKKTVSGYVLEQEVEEKLSRRAKREILFKEIGVAEGKDRVDVTAKLSEEAVFQVFAVNDPLRLVIDILDTTYFEPTFTYPLQKLGVKNIRTGQYQIPGPHSVARMVFDLNEPKFYTINPTADKIVVSFFREGRPQAPPITAQAPSKTSTEWVKSPEPPKSAISKAPWTRTPSTRETQVAIPPAPKAKAPWTKAPEPEYVRVPATPTPEKPVKPAPVQYEQQKISPPQEKLLEDKFKPKALAETEFSYSGDLISLKFKDADIRDVILYLGFQYGFNVIFDPEVRATVSCDFVDIPWDQALDIILKQHKMGKAVDGNILRIAPLSVLTREEEELRRFEESKELSGPIVTKMVVLSYSKVKDIQLLLASKISERGEIIFDDRTNTLVMSDVKNRIEMLEKLIEVFDIPTPQVTIEARVIEASSNFIRQVGVQWGFRGISDPFYGNQTSLQFPNNAVVDGALIPGGTATRGISGPLGGYAVNLPAPAFSSALGLSFGNVMDTFRIDMAISALESTGEGRIISSPTVTTQNNKEATILQGSQIPVQVTSNFTTSVRFVNAALELRATPQITADGTIIMDIDIRNNSADFGNLVNGIPPIITQSASSTVTIADGGTTVIGGIFRTEESVSRERTPLLHKIPILGALFRNMSRTRQNRELLIFITPRIVK
jgi:type IV pilus assembly protein PilQ